MDDASSTWRIIAALFFIVLNAFFVASEFAIVKVRTNRMRELAQKGNYPATLATRITQNVDAYLSACQLGITMASIALGWIGVSAIRNLLSPVISLTMAGVLSYAVITFVHTVAGEQVPKHFSIHKAEATALWCAIPLHLFYLVSSPVIWLLNITSNACLHLLGMKNTGIISEGAHTEEEIRAIVSSSQEYGVLEEHEVQLVENVLDYTDRVAREIMTPRNDVTVIYTDQTLEEATQFVLSEGYTRYPLCHGDRDNVVGTVHIRDIFALHCSGEVKSLEDIARQPLIIPETLPLPQVRRKFQETGVQIAIVVDEYGAFSGIVTLEDIIEEVFGDVRDEFDEIEREMVLPTEHGLELDAGMLVEEAMEALGVTSEVEVEGVDTIGGLVFSLLANKPEKGDSVEVDGYRLQVAEVEGLRITRLIANRLDAQAEADLPASITTKAAM